MSAQKNKIWIWTAVDHFSPGILTWAVGDRSSKTFESVWETAATWQCFFYVVEANLVKLNETFQIPYLTDLIDLKKSAAKNTLEAADIEFHHREYQRLSLALETARDQSHLPEEPSAQADLHDLLLRLRLNR